MKETPSREHDKYLLLLTSSEGVLSVYVRGARRSASRFLTVSQLLVYSRVTLFEHKGKYTLDDAEPLETFFALRKNLEGFSLATYAAELAGFVCAEGVPHPEILSLLLNTCHVLCREKYPPALVKAALELRLMADCGFAPFLDACGICGASIAASFHLHRGMLHCARCREALRGGLSLPLHADAQHAMQYILSARNPFSFTLDGEPFAQLCAACEGFLLAQLERSFASLDFYKSFTGQKNPGG